MSRAGKITRRAFLITSAAVAGGVAFGAYVVRRPVPNPLLRDLQADEAAITPFVKITPQGITLIVPRADIGQGIASTQAHLIAEELDIDPHTASLDPGQPDAAYFNGTVAADGLPFALTNHGFVAETARAAMVQIAKLSGSQFTGGSSSTSDLRETLRLAGATARETLKEALPANRHRCQVHRAAGLRYRCAAGRHAARHRATQPGHRRRSRSLRRHVTDTSSLLKSMGA